MHCTEEPVAAPVAGEHSTGPIRTVGGRRQAQDDDPSGWITEPRDRPSPVLLVAIGRPLLDSNSFTPLDQSRAGPTVHDLAM